MDYIGPHTALILKRRCQEYMEQIEYLIEQNEIMRDVCVAAQESWMRNMDDATSITYIARDALIKCSELETKFTQRQAREWALRDAQYDQAGE